MFKQLTKSVKHLVKAINAYGIPLPMVRDPKTKAGSVSLTLVFLSSALVIIGCVGRWSGKLGDIDISHALEFFYASSALYFGRNWRKGGASGDLAEEASEEVKDESSKVEEKVDNPDVCPTCKK